MFYFAHNPAHLDGAVRFKNAPAQTPGNVPFATGNPTDYPDATNAAIESFSVQMGIA